MQDSIWCVNNRSMVMPLFHRFPQRCPRYFDTGRYKGVVHIVCTGTICIDARYRNSLFQDRK